MLVKCLSIGIYDKKMPYMLDVITYFLAKGHLFVATSAGIKNILDVKKQL